MRFVLLLLSINFYGLLAQVQYIHHSAQPITDVDLISPRQIKDHKVKGIRAKYAYKYDKEIMHLIKKEVYYFYDTTGYPRKIKESNHYRHKADSVVDLFYYRRGCLLSTHVHTDAQGSMVYTFDENKGRYRHSAYLVPLDLNWNENLSQENLLWSDSITLSENNKFIFHNEFGKAYQYLIERRGENGQLTGIDLYQHGGKLIWAYDYDITSDDLIRSIEARPSNKLMFSWRKEFTYDMENRLTEVKYYKDGQLETYRRISYSADGLPDIDITRNEITTKMEIVKYEYVRYR